MVLVSRIFVGIVHPEIWCRFEVIFDERAFLFRCLVEKTTKVGFVSTVFVKWCFYPRWFFHSKEKEECWGLYQTFVPNTPWVKVCRKYNPFNKQLLSTSQRVFPVFNPKEWWIFPPFLGTIWYSKWVPVQVYKLYIVILQGFFLRFSNVFFLSPPVPFKSWQVLWTERDAIFVFFCSVSPGMDRYPTTRVMNVAKVSWTFHGNNL